MYSASVLVNKKCIDASLVKATAAHCWCAQDISGHTPLRTTTHCEWASVKPAHLALAAKTSPSISQDAGLKWLTSTLRSGERHFSCLPNNTLSQNTCGDPRPKKKPWLQGVLHAMKNRCSTFWPCNTPFSLWGKGYPANSCLVVHWEELRTWLK